MTLPPGNDNDHTVLAPGAAFPNALQPGTKLGEFEITCVVGQGGFGIVYHARDTSLGRDVALKEYMPAAFAGRVGGTQVTMLSEHYAETFQVGLHSFVNEAQLLAQFDHPCLVKVYRFWEANGTGYMAMPFYRAPTLKQLLKEDHADLADEGWLMSFLGHILDALEVLHAKNCYHRDIAPDNILMLDTDKPLLLDFGAARRVIGDMTQALTVILKPGYAPIEQYGDMMNMQQGPWTDFYALASVVYFIIADKVPPAALSRLVSDSMVPLTEAAKDRYSQQFLQAIDSALGVKPDQRPQNVAEFRALLGLEQPKSTIQRGHGGAMAAGGTTGGPATQGKTGGPATQGKPTAGKPADKTAGKPTEQSAGRPAEQPAAEPEWPKPRKTRKLTVFLATTLVATLAGAGGWIWWNEQQKPAVVPPPAPAVAAADVAASVPPPADPAPEPAATPDAAPAMAATPAIPTAPPPPPCPLQLADGTPACPAMVTIPAGTYTMGVPAGTPGALPEEMGGTPVQLASFDLAAREITVEQWQLCVKDKACSAVQGATGPESAKLPVTAVSWDASKGYADWLSKKTGASYRLPSEAEWEYAARAGAATTFPWGDQVGQDYAHCGQCGSHLDFRKAAAAGSFKAYGGLYDMIGNVYEWVDDCWHASHAEEAKMSPSQTAAACKKRVQKGGAYDSTEADVRPVARTFGDRQSKDPRVGFRVVRVAAAGGLPASATVTAAIQASSPAAATKAASAAASGSTSLPAAAASRPAPAAPAPTQK